MSEPIGRWAIAEGYMPDWSSGPNPHLRRAERTLLLSTIAYASNE